MGYGVWGNEEMGIRGMGEQVNGETGEWWEWGTGIVHTHTHLCNVLDSQSC